MASVGDGAIQVEMIDPLKPAVFCPIDDDDFLALNMPVRL
jgi:DNA polymerase III sliding clamp (beta) subunit (PCNA family)